MKVLVTGATGFTGNGLTRRLLADGHEVVGLDNQKGLFWDELSALGADLRIGSVTDEAAVRAATEGCEIVHHLAAAFRQLDVPDSHYDDVNVEGTRVVCQAALDCGVRRVMYCSTQGVHGHIEHPPGDENSPIAPADHYQLTKYKGEEVVQDFVANKGLSAVIVRPTAIYGPGDPARFLHLYKLARRGTFHMFGRGKTFYHPVYIDNLVDCFILAAEKGPDGRAYLAADEEYFAIEELVKRVGKSINVDVKVRHWPFAPLYAAACVCELVCKPLKISPPLFRRRVDWFRQVRAFSIDRARDELGYDPKVGIDEGLRRTGVWYKENGYL
ncbi:MAG: epimerase [Phycisphaeraceae bacterium]|nr:MAG: epimerase [Phycisphaeraceae bacterium]